MREHYLISPKGKIYTTLTNTSFKYELNIEDFLYFPTVSNRLIGIDISYLLLSTKLPSILDSSKLPIQAFYCLPLPVLTKPTNIIIVNRMRVVGIGIDLVMNSRIQQILTKNYSERFIRKFLHEHELRRYFQMQNECEQIQFVASRWAVKEALSKAIGRKELTFNQINIIKDRFGKPHVSIEGDDNERLFLELQIGHCHVSITHQKEYTIGTAIVEER